MVVVCSCRADAAALTAAAANEVWVLMGLHEIVICVAHAVPPQTQYAELYVSASAEVKQEGLCHGGGRCVLCLS